MDWGTLVGTVSGAVIAISGTVLADHLHRRHDDDRGLVARRRDAYLAFIVAAGVCHTRLRQIAQDPDSHGAVDATTRAALTDAGIYEAREQLFIDATAAVAGAGQAMFERLRTLRQAIGVGAAQSSAAFHDAYHPFLDAVWHYRAVVREEMGTLALAPTDFGWNTWDGLERCPLCHRADRGG
ncbi:MAG: CchlQ [Frankia sp.]